MSAHAADTRGEGAAARRAIRAEAIRDAAEALFVGHGYDAVSMDLVARAAGVSKPTLYKYFPSKGDLLMCVVGAWLARTNARLLDFDPGDRDLRRVLRRVAGNFGAAFLSEDSLAFRRMAAGALPRHPELERLVIENGPSVVMARLADYFRTRTESGDARIDEPDLAAELFHGLVNGNVGMSGAMLIHRPSEAMLARRFDRAVDMFVGYYGPR